MLKRNYGIDLLKIVLAFMVIIIHIHAGGTGQVLLHSSKQPWKVLALIITYFCYPAVNTYILITGYYSFEAKKDLNSAVKNLSQLWMIAVFFSLFGYFVCLMMGNTFSLFDMIKRFFPITRGVWWFYTVYFALILLSPFIDKMLDSLDIKEHKMLLVILLLILSIFPIFVNWDGKIGSNYGYSLIWFIALYVTGAYLMRIKIVNNKYLKKTFVFIIIYCFSTGCLYIVPKIFLRLGVAINLAMYNSIFVYIQSIALFVAFGNLSFDRKISKIVGSISSLSLASYLLHCQEDIEKILWLKLNLEVYTNSMQIIYVTILICISIFGVGILLEFVRKNLCRFLKIDKFFVSMIDKCYMVLVWLLGEKGNKDV